MTTLPLLQLVMQHASHSQFRPLFSISINEEIIRMIGCRIAGVDRLTFSVIWEMTAEGRILQQWCGRTVISSCAKLAYGHAQDMIEGEFDAGRPPVPLTAPHTWCQVSTCLCQFSQRSE